MRDIYKKNIDKFMKFINEDEIKTNEKPLVIKEEVKTPPPIIIKDNTN